MKKARRVIQFLNLFPQVPGRVWVDAYSIIALVKFLLGKPVDTGTLAVILGTYAVSKVAKAYASDNQSGSSERL